MKFKVGDQIKILCDCKGCHVNEAYRSKGTIFHIRKDLEKYEVTYNRKDGQTRKIDLREQDIGNLNSEKIKERLGVK